MMQMFFSMALVTAVMLSMAMVPCSATTTEGTEWVYRTMKDKWSPKDWGHFSPSCNVGNTQSPIDFSQVSVDWNLRPLHALWGSVNAYTVKVTPKRTLRIYLKDHRFSLFDRNSKLTEVNNPEYLLDYIDIVSPSAHTFGGSHRDVELMYVHSAADTNQNSTTTSAVSDADGIPRYVVSSTFQATGEGNTYFSTLLHGFSNNAEVDNKTQAAYDRYVAAVSNGTENSDTLKDTVGSYTESFKRSLNLGEGMPSIRDYYTYYGSLQRPPCPESVRWAVFTEPSPIGYNQVLTIRRLLNLTNDQVDPNSGIVEGNNRPMEDVPTNRNSPRLYKDFVGDTILLAEPQVNSVQVAIGGITWGAVGCSIGALVLGLISLRVAYA